MTARTRRSTAATTTAPCGACGTPLIRQPGECIPIAVDAQPIPAGSDQTIRGPNRLTWCAPPLRAGTGPPRLRWIYPGTHPQPCPHPHHADHHCTPRTPPAPAQPQPGTLF